MVKGWTAQRAANGLRSCSACSVRTGWYLQARQRLALAMRTVAAQLHLRQVLGAVGAQVLGGEAYLSFQEGLIDEAGAIADESTSEFLKAYMARFAHFVEKLRV